MKTFKKTFNEILRYPSAIIGGIFIFLLTAVSHLC